MEWGGWVVLKAGAGRDEGRCWSGAGVKGHILAPLSDRRCREVFWKNTGCRDDRGALGRINGAKDGR